MDKVLRSFHKFTHNYYELSRGLSSCRNEIKCKLLVVGGGSGGCSVAARFARKLNKGDIVVLEPSKTHYYQPLFTLVGAGIKKFPQSHRPLKSILPNNVVWLCDRADFYDPCNNLVYTESGTKVFYEYMVVAVGLENDYDMIIGLEKALKDRNSRVSTIYSPEYCQKCWCSMQGFSGGHAIFTFPKKAGKCSGAAQKIMYLAHDYWTRNKLQSNTDITFNTASDALFGVPKFANALTRIALARDIVVNYRLDLIEVTPKWAVFLDCNGLTISLPYKFLHVTPSMSTPVSLARCEQLADGAGFLDVDRHTLRHIKYCNVYGVGDCTNTPNSKTAAAVAKQSHVLEQNLWSAMYGKQAVAAYDGYGACPMLTSARKGIIAEFNYDKKLCETFPFDQSKERRLFSIIQKDVLPYIYWNKMMKGKWNGPAALRRIINPFGK